MATITSNQSGNWGDTSTWVGGVLPANNDDVIIAAGHSVRMNVDLSGITGLNSLVIQGSDGTPGMLYWMNGYSGYLKLKNSAGVSIQGTAGANKGRILVNSDGVWGNTGLLNFSTKAILVHGYTDCTYLDMRVYCSSPTIKKARLYGSRYTVTLSGSTFTGATLTDGTIITFITSGTLPGLIIDKAVYRVINASGNTFQVAQHWTKASAAYTIITPSSAGTGTLEILTQIASGATSANVYGADLTTDSYWSTTADHNYIQLVNHGNFSQDNQLVTLTNITSTSISFSPATDSVHYPLSYVILVSRNVSLRLNGMNSDMYRGSLNFVLKAECRALTTTGTVPTGTSNRGTLISNQLASYTCNAIINEIVSGFQLISTFSTGCNFDGIFVNCSQVFSQSYTDLYANETYSISDNCEFYSIVTCIQGCVNRVLNLYAYGCVNVFSNLHDCSVNGTAELCGTVITSSIRTILDLNCLCSTYIINACSNISSKSTTSIVCGRVLFQNTLESYFIGTILGCLVIHLSSWQLSYSFTSLTISGIIDLSTGGVYNSRGTVNFINCDLTFPITSEYSTYVNQLIFSRVNLQNINGSNANDGFIDHHGKGIRVASASGAGVPVSYDGISDFLKIYDLNTSISSQSFLLLLDNIKVWCLAGSRTLRVRIVNSFSTAMTAGDLVLEVYYLSSDGYTLVTNKTFVPTNANDWSQYIDVSFTQDIDNFVNVTLKLKKYESGNVFYVWPWPEVI